jgi:hypothetical protein
MSLKDYATQGEAHVARRIVRECLKTGYSLSVYDGEEWTVKRSTSFKTVCDALATTGEDYLRIFRQDGKRIGTLILVYGNAPDGCELVSDYSWSVGFSDEMDRIASLCD